MAKKITRSVIVSYTYPWGNSISEADYKREVKCLLRASGGKHTVRSVRQNTSPIYMSGYKTEEVNLLQADVDYLRNANSKQEREIKDLYGQLHEVEIENSSLRHNLNTACEKILDYQNKPKRRWFGRK